MIDTRPSADNRNMLRRWLSFVLLFALLIGLGGVASACPTCKDNLGDPSSANLARGFYYSILFMLSMPYLILGSIGLYFYLLVRKARREKEAVQVAAEPVVASALIHVPEKRELVSAGAEDQ